MIDDSRRHEQRRLERGVIHDVKHARDRGQRAVEPEEQRDESEMADGRIGEQLLEVVLEHRDVRAEQERRHARAADQPNHSSVPESTGQRRAEEKDAGLDHRGRVQVRGDRRGRCHRPRQPEVEWKLRAFGKRSEQDEHERHGIERVGAHDVARGEQHVEGRSCRRCGRGQNAAEQRQSARAGHRQRHERPSPRVFAVVPVADQQEGEQARELPEDHELNEVAREDDTEHGAHEGEEAA